VSDNRTVPGTPGDPTIGRSYDFDVAASFAAEDRGFVEGVVNALKRKGVRIFYDDDEAVELWGEDLAEYFDEVFRFRARFALLFVSQHYAHKMWARYERRSSLARSLEDEATYMLPVRLDDTELRGLRPTLGYLDARRFGTDGIVAAVLRKLGTSDTADDLTPVSRVPRSEAERQRILLEKPPGWEYLYFASLLQLGKDSLERKYRDHELGFGERSERTVPEEEVVPYLLGATNEARRLMHTFDRLFLPEAQERAFGRPGEPGDAEKIKHLAMRWTSIYEELLDWPARLRGVATPDSFSRAVDVLAHFNDESIENYRTFVDDFVRQNDDLSQVIARGDPVTIEMKLSMTIPEALVDEFLKSLEAAAGGTFA